MVPATAWTAMSSINSYLVHSNKTNHPEITCNILDPVSTIIRLGLLVFYPRGTKITIYQNSVMFDEPGFFQGPIRWSKGNTRTELHNLCKPIVRFSETYSEYSELRKYAVRGLQRLQQSYKNDTSVTTYSIQLYCKTLRGPETTSDANNSGADEEKTNETPIDCSTFDKLWTKEEIHIIVLLMKQLSNSRMDRTVSNLDMVSRTNKKKYYLKAIHNILKAKDECVQYRIKTAANQI